MPHRTSSGGERPICVVAKTESDESEEKRQNYQVPPLVSKRQQTAQPDLPTGIFTAKSVITFFKRVWQ